MATTYAIPNGRTVMDATTYTGTNSSLAISNADNGTTGFKPDLVWIKSRSGNNTHDITDSVRGVSKYLFSNLTNAEETATAGTAVTALNSNGFTLGTETSTSGSTNSNGATYVAWQWQAGQGTTSSNTSGSITSTVSVNAAAGFSVVSWTAPNSGTSGTVGHGLGVTPSMYIVKYRSVGGDWRVYHSSLGQGQYLVLNTTASAASSTTVWNNTAPTSTVFSVGSNYIPDAANNTLITYCWAPVAGFSQFGSYTGNGSTDGPFIYTGFRPKFVMVKRTSATGYWYMYDSSRAPYNANQSIIQAQDPQAEYTGVPIDFVSNGFKLRTTDIYANANGFNFIYMAFAENPFKYANAR